MDILMTLTKIILFSSSRTIVSMSSKPEVNSFERGRWGVDTKKETYSEEVFVIAVPVRYIFSLFIYRMIWRR